MGVEVLAKKEKRVSLAGNILEIFLCTKTSHEIKVNCTMMRISRVLYLAAALIKHKTKHLVYYTKTRKKAQ